MKTKTLVCSRGMLIALSLLASMGNLAHADTTGERDRGRGDARTNERREARSEARTEARTENRTEARTEARTENRHDDRRDERRDDRRESVQSPRETRQDRRDDGRDTRAVVRQDARVDRRDDRRDDRRSVHVERRHYPSRGAVIHALPPAHRVVTHRGGRYMFSNGVWYRPSGSRFVVIAPPFGIVVPVLPLGYLTLRIGPSRYYYANEVYYAPAPQGYVVVERPAGAPEYPEDELADDEPQQFIYPRLGQSEAQQADDRYECHRWSREQTGFDPTRPVYDGSNTQSGSARSDYYRAMGACLDGRGYTVR